MRDKISAGVGRLPTGEDCDVSDPWDHCGGWNDFIGAYATLEDAQTACRQRGTALGYEHWWQIVDVRTL